MLDSLLITRYVAITPSLVNALDRHFLLGVRQIRLPDLERVRDRCGG
jgi:hypothetical protein